MNLEPLFRFVDGSGNERLSLNTDDGFELAGGLDIGVPGEEIVLLSQQNVDDEEEAAYRLTGTAVVAPIVLKKQDSWADIVTLQEALWTEAQRATNVLEWRPIGAGTSYLIDTRRFVPPSLFRGQSLLVDCLLQDTAPMTLVIPRRSVMRQAGEFI